MSKILLFLAAVLLVNYVNGQDDNDKKLYVSLSGGFVSFGSGDFIGYSGSIAVSKQVNRNASFGLSKFLLGGELFFENGVKNPVLDDGVYQPFQLSTFYHVSSSILWAKAAYYPLRRIIPGLHLELGPTVGYSYRSSAGASHYSYDIFGHQTKTSTLVFDNGFTYGYRVSVGIEANLSRTLFGGLRADFVNNSVAEINTLAGLKVGIRF